MSKRRYQVGKWFGSVVLVSLILSGCSSLQLDITPPPAETQVEEIKVISQPTLTPAQPAATLSPDELGSEVIVVNVIDHTGGLLVEGGLEVELEVYEDFELVYEDTDVLTSDKRVIFEEVPFLESRVYFASISYGGAIYRSEIVELGAGSTLLELTIPIYETTTSDENLVIDRVHLLADFPSSDFAQIVEIFILSNLGNATVVAGNPGEVTVSFPLPANAESIEFDNGVLGQRYLKTEDGFGDTVSVPPGSGVYQVLVYYQLPIRRNRINFSQLMIYPVQAVVVMTPAGEAVITRSTLEDQGEQAIPDGSVHIYTGAGLTQGESLEFRLSIESETSILSADGTEFLSQDVLIGAGVLGGVIFLVGIWLIIRQRRDNLKMEEDPDLSDRHGQILDSIIALEDLYQEGEIVEKDYLKKRQELTDELAELEQGKE